MVNVIQLPPQSTPKQRTAQRGIRGLHEHFLAFLNANNPEGFAAEDTSSGLEKPDGDFSTGGFAAEEIYSIGKETIAELLLSVAQRTSVTENDIKRSAKKIKRASNGALIYSRALELVSRAFGYSCWYEVKTRLKRRPGPIKNQTTPDRLKLKLFVSNFS